VRASHPNGHPSIYGLTLHGTPPSSAYATSISIIRILLRSWTYTWFSTQQYPIRLQLLYETFYLGGVWRLQPRILYIPALSPFPYSTAIEDAPTTQYQVQVGRPSTQVHHFSTQRLP